MRLKDRVAIVTGGSGGIGIAICEAFAAEGAIVIVSDIDAENAERVADDLRRSGADATALHADVSEEESAEALIDGALRQYSRVDILVNNAGARIIKGLTEHTLSDWQKMIAINLTGPFLCSRAVIPHMVAQGSGNIINLGSIASFTGRPNRCGYVAAKSGVLGLTRAMAADLAGKNVRVNTIAPGMIASPFNKSFAEAPDTGEAWAGENLVGRWGQPADIAGAAVYLASDDSSFVNGSEIKIEGGWLGARSRSGEIPIWPD
ncbi:glucose 1-dehydrogenase [Marivita sp.]|uniref:SDR family NAD(P)-dependent oxidoreductase n=1 Tax=Marivita sp. TaxID=2003365 RepID=UPI0025B92FB1|nr:glucose 1-dehydrogenase [Marivita sp.]